MVASEARTTRTAEGAGGGQLVRALVASTLASTLDWYAFFLFGGAAAAVLGRLFFPTSNGFLTAVLLLSALAAGFVARPVGAMLFGHLGDRIGRRATLTATLLLAGLASVLVALLPTYAQAGVLGGLLLFLLRIVQGIAAGGEWAGSVLLSIEWDHRGRRGFLGSWTQLGMPAGLALAYGAVWLFTSWLGVDAGWRVPFLLSVLLIGVAVYLRLGVRETPVFSRLLADRRIEYTPVLETVALQWREVALTALLRIGQQTPFYLFTVFVLTDATRPLGLRQDDALGAVLLAAALSVAAILGWGYVSDIVGRRRLVMLGAVAMLLWAFPYWALLGTRETALVLVAVILSLLIHDVQYAPQAALIAESFTGRLRYSGTALGSQLGSLLADGPAPLIALAVIGQFGDARLLAIYVAACAAITLAAASGLRDRARQDMSAEYDDPAAAPRPPRA
jgi:MFS family permease